MQRNTTHRYRPAAYTEEKSTAHGVVYFGDKGGIAYRGKATRHAWHYIFRDRERAVACANVEFFQAVEVKAKSLIVRRIGSHSLGNDGGASMSDRVTPNLHEFIGDPKTVRIQIYANEDGSPTHYMNAPTHGNLSAWDGRPKYVSWYA